MKNLIIIILLSVAMLFSAGLKSEAVKLRGLKDPIIYTRIKEGARNKWADNPEMMVYEINKQSIAFFKVSRILKSSDYQEELFDSAFKKWKYNFEMVVYEYTKQLAAKKALDF